MIYLATPDVYPIDGSDRGTETTPDKQLRPWIVALTERYESEIMAVSREDAIDQVSNKGHGGSSPVYSRITVYLDGRQQETE